jgi:hypothetical protein
LLSKEVERELIALALIPYIIFTWVISMSGHQIDRSYWSYLQ